MNPQTSITIFATYWNERDWIEASLAQIDIFKPHEVIIVDGCFDTKYENKSTDGTREVIEKWVDSRPNATMISALRKSRIGSLWYLFGHGLTWWNWPLRIALMIYYARTNIYRINQACTFAFMLHTAKNNKPGDWIMHIDADQFYPDTMIEKIKKITTDPNNKAELLTANEQTFFTDFNHYTIEYESRNYNNMPYKLRHNTIIVPTRDVVLEKYPKPAVFGKDTKIKKICLGSYFHYKFRPYDAKRLNSGYNVGDRKKPNISNYLTQTFTGEHPSIIQNNFLKLFNS